MTAQDDSGTPERREDKQTLPAGPARRRHTFMFAIMWFAVIVGTIWLWTGWDSIEPSVRRQSIIGMIMAVVFGTVDYVYRVHRPWQ